MVNTYSSENTSIRRIGGVRYGVLGNLEWAPRLKYSGTFIIRFPIRRIGSSGYGVLGLLVVDAFAKLGHGYAVFVDVNTTYLGSSGYGVLGLLVVDAFAKLGNGYAVFVDVNTTYLGITSLFWMLTKVSYTSYMLMWIQRILQSQAMVLNSSKSWDMAHLSRMIRCIGC
ncbi:hypothetical protein Tco_0727665 [Tanacetum coccineum]|uniref:Uncharacterized protein n=1 Tax=Tanacetum coccineum TaxID=301880 RepID=A0ABQ4YIZ1_9ASTR